jgi:hypothetical protein
MEDNELSKFTSPGGVIMVSFFQHTFATSSDGEIKRVSTEYKYAIRGKSISESESLMLIVDFSPIHHVQKDLKDLLSSYIDTISENKDIPTFLTNAIKKIIDSQLDRIKNNEEIDSFIVEILPQISL